MASQGHNAGQTESQDQMRRNEFVNQASDIDQGQATSFLQELETGAQANKNMAQETADAIKNTLRMNESGGGTTTATATATTSPANTTNYPTSTNFPVNQDR